MASPACSWIRRWMTNRRRNLLLRRNLQLNQYPIRPGPRHSISLPLTTRLGRIASASLVSLLALCFGLPPHSFQAGLLSSRISSRTWCRRVLSSPQASFLRLLLAGFFFFRFRPFGLLLSGLVRVGRLLFFVVGVLLVFCFVFLFLFCGFSAAEDFGGVGSFALPGIGLSVLLADSCGLGCSSGLASRLSGGVI